jgi:hypothetical protein
MGKREKYLGRSSRKEKSQSEHAAVTTVSVSVGCEDPGFEVLE